MPPNGGLLDGGAGPSSREAPVAEPQGPVSGFGFSDPPLTGPSICPAEYLYWPLQDVASPAMNVAPEVWQNGTLVVSVCGLAGASRLPAASHPPSPPCAGPPHLRCGHIRAALRAAHGERGAGAVVRVGQLPPPSTCSEIVAE